MHYSDRLKRWAVIRLLPNCQRDMIAHCRTQSDADGYCKILRQLQPDATLIVMFDPPASIG